MPDDDDVDVRLLLPHAAGLRGAGRGGRRWGGRWERSCLLGDAAGEESGASKRVPLMPAPSQPFGKGCPPLAPPSRWTIRPGVPGLVWQLCPGWGRASLPPEEAGRAISGCHIQPPSLGRMPCFSASCPPPPSRRPPVPRATSWMLRRCPSSLENLPFSLFPNPRECPPCRGCPGRSRGCPSSRAALTAPRLGTVQVTNRASAKWGGQK